MGLLATLSFQKADLHTASVNTAALLGIYRAPGTQFKNVTLAVVGDTSAVYTCVLNRGGRGVQSPLDRLRKGVSVESRGIMRIEASA